MKRLFTLLALMLVLTLSAQSHEVGLNTNAIVALDSVGSTGTNSNVTYSYISEQDEDFSLMLSLSAGYNSYYDEELQTKTNGTQFSVQGGFYNNNDLGLLIGGNYNNDTNTFSFQGDVFVRPIRINKLSLQLNVGLRQEVNSTNNTFVVGGLGVVYSL